MNAGALDRRLQFRRATLVQGPFGQQETWADHGSPVWGSRKDVRDTEKAAAGQIASTIMSRFVVRWSELTRQINAKDRFTCDGLEWLVIGVKETGERRRWIEITAETGSD